MGRGRDGLQAEKDGVQRVQEEGREGDVKGAVADREEMEGFQGHGYTGQRQDGGVEQEGWQNDCGSSRMECDAAPVLLDSGTKQ